MVQMDWHGDRARGFVDDFLVGSQRIPQDARLATLRFTMDGPGGVWLDAFALAERLAPLKRLPGPLEQDEIWLASGDQVFGDLLEADGRTIVVEARFGKRSYPWSAVRGAFFRGAAKTAPVGRAVEVRFRSGPGVSADQLTADMIDLNDRRLRLRHAVLGELEIERSRLERIRFPEPVGPITR
jgi:hypothetical protein